ncbi:putative TonB family protein [Verrucomicrobia bacterium]|nr:putative TonB family protein [Verrucomicrobiota bacterium]
MNRLQKKCFIASAGCHLLLALILVVGPAFISSRSRLEDMPTIDFVPTKLIDQAFSGGGNPRAQPPPPAPPAPAQPALPPPPQPQQASVPEPPKERVPRTQPDPESLEPAKETRTTHLPEISTTVVKRKPRTNSTPREPSEADSRAQRLAAARSQAAALIGHAANSLRNDLSPSTTIDDNYGPDGGGEAYANYAQFVKSVYENAWIPPDDAANDEAITKVTITIASNGSVVSSHIIRRSGDSSVDSSVQRTLDRVTYIAPFPEGSKDKQRIYTINFNLKAKRLLG